MAAAPLYGTGSRALKLERVIIEGFRGHRERPQMPIDRLAAFITEGGSGFTFSGLDGRGLRSWNSIGSGIPVDTAAAIVAAEQHEIVLYTRNSAFAGYGYYVAGRTAERTARAVRPQDK